MLVAECWKKELFRYSSIKKSDGLGPNIGHGSFVGWVEHPDIFCWVSFLYPTYLPAIVVLSVKPNKMAEDRTISKSIEYLANPISIILVDYWCSVFA